MVPFLDFQVAANYATIWLSFEIASIFIYQKLKEPKKRPIYLLSFSLLFITVGIMQLFRLLNAMMPSLETFMNPFHAFIPTLMFPTIVGLSYDFFKNEHPKSRIFLKGLLILSIPCLVVALVNIFVMGLVDVIMLVTGWVAFISSIIIPLVMALSLFNRSSSGTVKPYRALIAGFIITTFSLAIHTPLVQSIISVITSREIYDFLLIISLMSLFLGLVLVLLGFSFVPPVEDIFWKKDLVSIYIMDKKSNMIIYKKSFTGTTPDTSPQESGSPLALDQEQEELLLGGLKGIDDLLAEITNSKGKTLEFIDQGSLKLIIEQDRDLLYLLISRRYLPVVKWKLYNFVQTFLVYYGDLIHKWIKEPDKFRIVDQLVATVFAD